MGVGRSKLQLVIAYEILARDVWPPSQGFKHLGMSLLLSSCFAALFNSKPHPIPNPKISPIVSLWGGKKLHCWRVSNMDVV